jgi:hypothetical protein
MTAALHPAELLEASERGGSLHPIDRALLILGLVVLDDPSNLPIAERDRRLIELRRVMFGDALTCAAQCPECGEALEFQLTASGLLGGLRTASPPETITVSGWELALRPLDSRDLAAAARAGDREEAAAVLISRAFDVARRPDGAGDMPAAVLLKVEEIVGAREAAADIALDLSCPACRKAWTEGFDIGAYLWTEIDTAAQHLIGEVAALAQSFGWSEADILALPPSRRRSYLAAAGFA